MTEKWIVMLIIWVICGIVAIWTDAPGIMLLPAIGTLMAAM